MRNDDKRRKNKIKIKKHTNRCTIIQRNINKNKMIAIDITSIWYYLFVSMMNQTLTTII